MSDRTYGLPDLDPIIHPQVRLQVMTILCSLSPGERIAFTDLQEVLRVSPGNLGAHLAKLEEAEYVVSTKAFRGRRPVTWLEATQAGRTAFATYVSNLQAYIKPEE